MAKDQSNTELTNSTCSNLLRDYMGSYIQFVYLYFILLPWNPKLRKFNTNYIVASLSQSIKYNNTCVNNVILSECYSHRLSSTWIKSHKNSSSLQQPQNKSKYRHFSNSISQWWYLWFTTHSPGAAPLHGVTMPQLQHKSNA